MYIEKQSQSYSYLGIGLNGLVPELSTGLNNEKIMVGLHALALSLLVFHIVWGIQSDLRCQVMWL